MPSVLEFAAPVFAHRYGLSRAEAEILALLAAGAAAKQVAARRGTSIETVRTQIRCLLEKGEVRSQRELLVKLATPPDVAAA